MKKEVNMTNAKKAKYYKIGTKEYSVGELTLSQDEAIADLLADVFGTDDFTESEDVLKSMIKGLAANKVLTKAMGIILTEKDCASSKEKAQQFFKEVGNLKNSQALEIFSDFLSQNEDSMNSLFDMFTTKFQKIKTKTEIQEEEFKETVASAATSAKSILDGETVLK